MRDGAGLLQGLSFLRGDPLADKLTTPGTPSVWMESGGWWTALGVRVSGRVRAVSPLHE